MTLLEIAKKTLELSEKATPPPWSIEIDWSQATKQQREDDRNMMVFLRNHADQMAKALVEIIDLYDGYHEDERVGEILEKYGVSARTRTE